MYVDPTYILIIIGVLLSLAASTKVKSTFGRYSQVRSLSGLTGAQTAERILRQGGSSLSAVLKTTVYLTDTEDFAEMNRAYGEMLPDLPRPARATVYVKSLSPGVKVEIDFVAAAQN